MLTDLNISIIIAVASGFIGGLSQSILEDIFRVKIDEKSTNKAIIIKKSLLLGVGTGIIFGIATFTLANCDTSMSVTKLNLWSIFVPLSLPLSVILTRILPLHLLWPHIVSRKNKINN